jgi:hypothetical protein
MAIKTESKTAKTTTKAAKGSKETTAIVRWDEKFAQYAKEGKEQLASIGEGGISVKFGHGTIEVDGKTVPGGKLNCVIVGYCAMNAWFKTKFNAKETTAPDCYAFAIKTDDPEMTPHAQAPSKQAEKCADCEKNQFGTADTGRGKACGNNVRLGIITATDIDNADDVKAAELATGKVSPTNLKRWKQYAEALEEEHGRPTWAVVTEITTHDDSDTQIRVEFRMVELINDDDVLDALEKRYLRVQEALQVPYSAAGAKDSKGDKRAAPATGKNQRFAAVGTKTTAKKGGK